MSVSEHAGRLRALHHAPEPLVLPNAWDAASARRVVRAGFPVVATTSGGIAASLGYRDGEDMPPDEAFAAVARIVRAVDVPVTADVEAGYGLAPAQLVEGVLVAGAVGCNLEDSDHRGGVLVEPDRQAARIAAVRAAAGADLVINARVDVFLGDVEDSAAALDEAVVRARRYLDAGADCVYPILLSHEPTIARFVEAVGAPVNIMLRPGAPSLATLRELGVARVSLGSGLFQAAQRAVDEHLAGLRLDAAPRGSPAE